MDFPFAREDRIWTAIKIAPKKIEPLTMDDKTVQKLLALNQRFYRKFAVPFSDSRSRPQQGFYELLKWLPIPCERLLDVGCGDGRLGRFVRQEGTLGEYVGLDFSSELLELAELDEQSVFLERDLCEPGSLEGTGEFDAVACLATLQHIPGRGNRRRLVAEMAQHLATNGRLLLSNWQFPNSKRQRRKMVAWSEIALDEGDVEYNDYLLTWRREGFGLRYVSYIDSDEVADLVGWSGLSVVKEFYSDGREGNLNLYTVCERVWR